MAGSNNIVIAHELMHTLGASDKYVLARVRRFIDRLCRAGASPRTRSSGRRSWRAAAHCRSRISEMPQGLRDVRRGPHGAGDPLDAPVKLTTHPGLAALTSVCAPARRAGATCRCIHSGEVVAILGPTARQDTHAGIRSPGCAAHAGEGAARMPPLRQFKRRSVALRRALPQDWRMRSHHRDGDGADRPPPHWRCAVGNGEDERWRARRSPAVDMGDSRCGAPTPSGGAAPGGRLHARPAAGHLSAR